MMNYFRALIIGIFLLMFIRGVYGDAVILDASSKVYFLNEPEKDIMVRFQCNNESLTLENKYVYFSNFKITSIVFDGYSYVARIKLLNIPMYYGLKPLKVVCVYSNNTQETNITYINIIRVKMEITKPTSFNPLTVYAGDYFEDLTFKILYNDVIANAESLSNVKVYIYNETFSSPLNDLLPPYYNDDGSINLIGRIPLDFPEGTYSLKISGDYVTEDSQQFTLTADSLNSLIIKPPLRIEVLAPVDKVEVKDSTDVVIAFKFYDHDVLTDVLELKNIDVLLDNKHLDIIDFSKSEDTYYVKARILKPLDINSYKKELYVVIKNYGYYGERKFKVADVYYVVKVAGSTLNKNGKLVPVELYFSSEEIEKSVKSDNTGKYEIYLPPGTYDLTVKAGGDIAKYYNVVITEDVGSLMRVSDLNPSSLSLNVVKAKNLELLLPYDSNSIRIYYQDNYIYDEKRLAVFYCENWDFALNKCKMELEDITDDSSINIVSNYVEIFNKSGAFLIGEKKYAVIDAQAEKENYFVGDRVIVSGVVRDLKGNGIDGLNVIYEVEGYDIKGETTTSKGVFEFSFPAPLPHGNAKVSAVKVIIRIDDSNIDYQPFTFSINIEKRAKINVDVDDVVKVEVGKKKIIPIIIENSGDLTLTDIEFKIEGISEKWYVISPAFIESLKPEESKEINLVVNIPQDYCKDIPKERCKEYYFINLRVTSEQTREDASFTLNVVLPNNNTSVVLEKTSTQKSQNMITSFKTFTGNMIKELNTEINKIVIITFFVLAFIIITIKKKRKTTSKPFKRVNFYKSLK